MIFFRGGDFIFWKIILFLLLENHDFYFFKKWKKSFFSRKNPEIRKTRIIINQEKT
jgi:hypothetical protein